MPDEKVAAAAALRGAASSFQAYQRYVAEGRLLANSGEDASDIVEAARLNIGAQLRACQELGFSDGELEALLAEMT